MIGRTIFRFLTQKVYWPTKRQKDSGHKTGHDPDCDCFSNFRSLSPSNSPAQREGFFIMPNSAKVSPQNHAKQFPKSHLKTPEIFSVSNTHDPESENSSSYFEKF